jgi:hypothetical protein
MPIFDNAPIRNVGLGQRLDAVNDEITAFPPKPNNTRITTATTTVVSRTPCWAKVDIQAGTMGLVTVYDNTAASGVVLHSGTPAAKDRLFGGDWVYCQTGLTIVTAAATEVFVRKLTV